eukprot:1153084-Pelagomonas_calceolata.AAC.14
MRSGPCKLLQEPLGLNPCIEVLPKQAAPAATARDTRGVLVAAGWEVKGCQAGIPCVVGRPSMARFSDTTKDCGVGVCVCVLVCVRAC